MTWREDLSLSNHAEATVESRPKGGVEEEPSRSEGDTEKEKKEKSLE